MAHRSIGVIWCLLIYKEELKNRDAFLLYIHYNLINQWSIEVYYDSKKESYGRINKRDDCRDGKSSFFTE